ncbi:Ca2+:Cation Antiporter (CaCA) Family [Trachipleistophora hominis]|uniref:Ca2+:Cation Antiporter (CaCA) Family n=1 Tax=Trachipleistophora hominis TaxID=72359 RepID=L7JSZ7_TRAHO|nr:Ca2+:Cation Antiporter (CaCA) Family [Trachipleistophora hominis]
MGIINTFYDLPVPFNYAAVLVLNMFMLFSGYLLVDEYLMQYLDNAVKQTKLQSELVAIIFLNIGNGLPELITGFLCGQKDLLCAIYCSIGGMLFIITVVLGSAILFKSKTVEIKNSLFYKNIMFLFLSYSLLTCILIREAVNIFIALFMVGTYAVFLVHSVVNNRNDTEEIETVQHAVGSNKYRKVVHWCLYPLRKLFDISLINQKATSTPLALYLCSVFANFIVFSYLLGCLSKKVFFIAVPVLLLLSAVLYFFDTITPNKMIMNCYSMFIAILWIFFTSDTIVNQIEMVSERFNMSKELSSLVFLAFGNSFADLVTNSIAARKGLVKTAVSSSMTSPIHNILFNFGLLLSYFTLSNGTIVLHSVRNAMFTVFPIVFVPIALFIISFNYEIRNRKLEIELAYTLFVIYGLFICLLGMEFYLGDYGRK